MRWTMGLLLFAAAGCGYHGTKMVACPESGCTSNTAQAAPERMTSPTPPTDDVTTPDRAMPPTPETATPPPDAPAPTP